MDGNETVELLQERIGRLVAERQGMRGSGAARDVLERNRLAIAHAQWLLSAALIARYLPAPEQQQAA